MILAIVQARLGSTRYPEKMLKALVGGKTLLENILERLNKTSCVDEIIVAIPHKDFSLRTYIEDELETWVHPSELDENDVLGRFVEACKSRFLKDDDWILRICGDAPFPEPMYINYVAQSLSNEADVFTCNELPSGQQVQFFNVGILDTAYKRAIRTNDINALEHIDPITEYDDVRVIDISPPKLSIDTKDEKRSTNKIL